MLTFLFWNLKTANDRILSNLVRQHQVDILILAECPLLPAQVLDCLNRPDASEFFYIADPCDKLMLFTRFSDEFVHPWKAGDDYTVRRITLPSRTEFLLCAVHFPSKLRQAPVDQTNFTFSFAQKLAEAEAEAEHARTILVGDLNMNPYEDGVVVAQGLHAVMTRSIALKESRTVKFESNLYFYNPMWSHFGENSPGHAGTFYYRSPKARADYWNIYDQVLIRPDLLQFFRDEDLSILWRDDIDNASLLDDSGIPSHKTASDHLPILFRLKI